MHWENPSYNKWELLALPKYITRPLKKTNSF